VPSLAMSKRLPPLGLGSDMTMMVCCLNDWYVINETNCLFTGVVHTHEVGCGLTLKWQVPLFYFRGELRRYIIDITMTRRRRK
jgi:hypothetical protein